MVGMAAAYGAAAAVGCGAYAASTCVGGTGGTYTLTVWDGPIFSSPKRASTSRTLFALRPERQSW